MRIVVVPSGFKESLSAEEVGQSIARGIKKVNPDHQVTTIPMVDGGEGFVDTITKLKEGKKVKTHVMGPVGKPIESFFGVFEENGVKTAVIEMAAIAGLRHVPQNMRNPLNTTTFGVGETIIKALDIGAERILIGCGDSGTSDGGVGMAQALGVKFLNINGVEIFVNGGGEIDRIHGVDMRYMDARVHLVDIDVAVNWTNLLCGKKGVARVYGPQKGASSENVEQLSNNLEHLARLIKSFKKEDVSLMNGGGASGGLGAGLHGFLNARLHPRFEIIMKYIEISDAIKNADLVITAEGCIDFQTPNGKIPSEVARIAKIHEKPVIAFAGTIGHNAKINYQSGIDAYSSIIPEPTTLENSILDADKWLENCSENALRHIMIGINLGNQMYVTKDVVQ
ncbi:MULTISPECIES: glycerate kinase [Mammaliicoccus]|uniref:Glycerate kinase n=1 Tax=Mammaliicoccus vitulinus TaxID=71237 RepID=A0A2T4PSX6_9STAP|nr:MULTISPECIES: glycerate kinase [Mammaliicoccus]HAL08813.1 glycerate kinase [Staphylococcus sp.]MBO3076896.1 glycerate kinase [Mammaliicoccus vitulinus]PTI29439.1 glycerate kinase [Mammaliicoccus vitulinus]PTI37295.1 glycerate kinase [Mammaliicoccus vitulinus]PTI72409.1 glycerate kinase [Mammaliicoccus vitulinus]